jgi:hypothetical protein
MVARRGVNKQTLVERVASELDPELLRLRPFLADGIDGFRRWQRQLRFVLELNGGTVDDVPALMGELGVDIRQVYLTMFRLNPPGRGAYWWQ